MTKLISPAPSGTDGLPFGSAKKPYSIFKRHKGKDWKWLYANPVGSKVTVAPIGGTVTVAYNDGGYHNELGNYVEIQVTRSVKVRLAHHETGSVRVRAGQEVKAGERIGTMGSTGKANGDHLHEELWVDGKRVNPDAYRGEKGKHLPGTPVPAGKPAYPFTKVTLAALNLRKKPKGTVITTIPEGTRVNTGRTTGGWTPVKYGTRFGWVAAEFAVITPKTTTRTLTLRDRPAPLKTANVKTRLPKGTRVEVLGVHGKTSAAKYWQVRVVKTGQTGWVVGEYLK